MEESNDRMLFAFFLFLLLVVLALAYAKLPNVRGLVDDKLPWFRENAGKYVLKAVPGAAESAAAESTPAPAPPPVFEIVAFAAHPETWPKSVMLRSDREFTAVINRKPVGTVRLHAGAEVHLVTVQGGKLGLEYQGGGAWVPPEATDVSVRFQAMASQNSVPAEPSAPQLSLPSLPP